MTPLHTEENREVVAPHEVLDADGGSGGQIDLLSVVVPCFNEEASLKRLYQEVTAATRGVAKRTEILLVDDGSKDGTLRVATEIAEAHPEVRVIGFSRNFGKESAMLAGLDHSRGDAVVIMDGDLQHPPHLIQEMCRFQAAGYDQVIARRDRAGDPKLRSGLSRAYYRLVNKMVDVELMDGVGDFRLLSRRAVDALVQLREVNRFSKGLFSWIGYPAIAIEYQNVDRAEGATSWSFARLLDYGVDGILSFNNKPLRAAIWTGLTLVVLSALYVAWLTVGYVTAGIESPGYLTLIAAVLGMGGTQLVFLGVIGEYVGRIYFEAKARPNYLVKYDSRHDP